MAFLFRRGILASLSWRVALPAGALFAAFAFAPAAGSIKALADGSKADKKTELRGSATMAARSHSGGKVASVGPAGANHVAMGTRRAAEAGLGAGSIGLTGSRGSTGAYHIAMGTRRAAEAGMGAASIGFAASRGSAGANHIAMGTPRAAEAGMGSGSIGLTGSQGSPGADQGLATRPNHPLGRPPNFDPDNIAIGQTGSRGSAGANQRLATTQSRPADFGMGIFSVGQTGARFSRESTVHSLATARTESGIKLASSTMAARADAATSNQRLGVTANPTR
jgi:hypothetical protein